MSCEIDHLFICVSAGGAEAERLIQLGLVEGSPNTHPGQGTANRRFFFHNAMLELLWVADAEEAQSATTRRARLWDRWTGRDHDGSPFGVCLRPSAESKAGAPFDAWQYRPAYLPAGLAIHVAHDNPLAEPLWFHLPAARRPDSSEPSKREPLAHPLGIRDLTGVCIHMPHANRLSAAATSIVQAGLLSIAAGPRHLLDLTFDGARAGRRADLRPDLPLLVRW